MIKNNKMKRKVPLIKVNIPYDEFIAIPEVREVIIGEVFIAIKEGIKGKKKSISLFEVANSNYYIDLDKQQWKSSLEKALEFFVEKEDYVKCIECRDLIKEL